jgi:hypothetical protein
MSTETEERGATVVPNYPDLAGLARGGAEGA